jgi:hypothetical protein
MASECTKVEGLMQTALDGELDAKGRARFDAHIKACPSCRRKYEALARAVAVFAAAPRLEPSPAFVADVMRRARRAKEIEARRRRAFTWITAAAAAAVGAGVVALWAGFLRPALGSTAASLASGLVTTAADVWEMAKALAAPGEVLGKIASARLFRRIRSHRAFLPGVARVVQGRGAAGALSLVALTDKFYEEIRNEEVHSGNGLYYFERVCRRVGACVG